jgi:hypothetical protein
VYRVLERVKFVGLCIIHIFVVGRDGNVFFFFSVSVPVPFLVTLQNTGCVLIQFALTTLMLGI